MATTHLEAIFVTTAAALEPRDLLAATLSVLPESVQVRAASARPMSGLVAVRLTLAAGNFLEDPSAVLDESARAVRAMTGVPAFDLLRDGRPVS